MDEVFRAENHHLQGVIARIHNEVTQHTQRSLEHKEKADATSVPPEALTKKQFHLEQAALRKDMADFYASFLLQPYFAHMELDYEHGTTSGTKSFYVGEKDLHIGAHQEVVDWRSEMGGTYYKKSETTFRVKGFSYDLALRRALQIKRGKLTGYTTEYDATDVSLEGRVVDPFLLTVLRDKRRQKALTNIISTIQENQNSIINQPVGSNFVVQGCAGSGKTMILLHRLSYLLYNNKGLSRKNIKIITPNKYFNTFISDLSEKLELHEIERLSVEEYYVRLIKAFSSKIDISSDVSSEMGLPHDFMELIYSSEFQEQIRESYVRYFDEQISALNPQTVISVLAKHNRKLPDMGQRKADAVLELRQLLTDIKNSYDGVIAKHRKEETRLKDALGKYQAAVADVKSQREACMAARDALHSSLASRMEKLEEVLPAQKGLLAALQTEAAEFGQTSEATAQELAALEHRVAEATELRESYRDYSSLLASSSEIAQMLVETNRTLVSQTAEAQTALSKVPAFNFSKRNALRKALAQLSSQLSTAVFDGIAQYVAQQEAQIDECRKALPQDPDAMSENKRRQEETTKKIKKANAELLACRICLSQLSDEHLPDLGKVLAKETYLLLEERVAPYQTLYSKLQNSNRLKTNYASVVSGCDEQLKILQRQLPESGEMESISEALTCLGNLEYQQVFSHVIADEVDGLYEAFRVKKTKKTYRFVLYLHLLCCTLFYKQPTIKDTFINIDEAQDIAVTEYAVLRSALGKNCVFNLYGDVNQLVYEYKGVSDWDELAEITGGQVFVLNENYRNTLQVTTYCNDVFGAEIYPIGISGEEVQTLTFEDALSWIHQRNANGDRTAILVGERVRESNRLKETSDSRGFAWMTVNSSNTSVITVEMAKGLEFDAVVAISADMNDNEKYIAFTRAMDALVVVE